jgi:zinc transport system substrate-binding protein
MPELTIRRFFFLPIASLAAILMLASAPAQAQDRPTVVAVNYALAYFAERLGGDDIEVTFPVPDGVDPAYWRPGIADISSIQAADLIVLNGAGFATWITKASLPRARIVDTSRGFEERFIATETVTHSHGADGEHSHTGAASFTWLDQDQAILQAGAIADALAQRGLVEPETVEARLSALAEDLAALDAAAERLRALAKGTVLIATHPRYQYFARAYGLDIRSLEWEAGAAPGADQLAELQARVEASGAQILLWEAEPPMAARDAIRDLGLADVVFPTLATAPAGSDYVKRLQAAIDELASVLAAVDG